MPKHVQLPGAHALWAPGLANVFEQLRVGGGITDGKSWRAIHSEPNVVISFELQHGREGERDQYNARSSKWVWKHEKPLLASHAGFSDWFVPVIAQGRMQAMLVTGPFATSPPTATEVLGRWRWLTGRQGHPADPEFSLYLETTLSTLVLDREKVTTFGEVLVRLARLMAGDQPARTLLNEADRLREKLEDARFVESAWEVASSMVDERTSRVWTSLHHAHELDWLGFTRFPDHVLVGLTVSHQHDSEPVDELLRHYAFQRACAKLAHSRGNTIAGRVGQRGVVFLSAAAGSSVRKRQRLQSLADDATRLARQSGLALHVGISGLASTRPLSEHYHAAFGAAESALIQGVRSATVSDSLGRRRALLGELRRQLGEGVEEHPDALPARFDRYLAAVAMRCGDELEPTRAHLEAGLERLVEVLLRGGALEQRSVEAIHQGLERSEREARTVRELFAAYRRVVIDLSEAIRQPATAHRDRSLRRAVTHIHQHYGEELSLAAVAKIAGFAPNYFSALFKEREGATFEQYLRRLRTERAKQLLTTTDLKLDRVAELAGLGTRRSMARVFRHHVGMTPRQCRQRLSPAKPPKTLRYAEQKPRR